MKTNNKINQMLKNSLIALPVFVAVFVVVGGLSGCAVEENQGAQASTQGNGQATGPARVVVVVDESESFAGNLPIASEIIADFIRENAIAGDSEVYVIKMDRSPDVLNYYSAEEMLDAEGEGVLEKIKKTNPQDGTDVVGALQLADQKLHKDKGAAPSRCVLLVFSDMNVDAATTPKRREFKSLESFSWANFKNVETHFYFVAPKPEKAVEGYLERAGIKGEVLDPHESKRVVLQDKVETE